MKLILMAVTLAVIALSCSLVANDDLGKDPIDSDLAFRIDVLYEHTVLMEEYSTPDMLEAIKLDMDQVSNNPDLTAEQKIAEMEKAFNLKLAGNYEEQLTQLESRMDQMMDEWVTLQ